MKILFLIFFMFSLPLQSQSKNPDAILADVIKNFDRVKDYVVDVSVKVDVEFLKVPDTKAKIYFKRPDKVHLESDGFALLPKEGIDFSPKALLKKKYTALYEKDVDLDGVNTSVVKIIPIGDEGNVILSTLWIDQKKNIIRKVESTTKTNGTFTINLYYDDNLNYPLPLKIVFSFNTEQMNLPKALNNDTESDQTKKKNRRLTSNTVGRVIVTYSNYRVNKGIPDSVFNEKDNSGQNGNSGQ